ncbi:MAG: LptA/OstA family protein, partial [bacterium]
MTDLLSIERDTTSDRLVWAEANGSVHAVYYQGPDSEEKPGQVSEEKGISPDNLNLPSEPHSVVTCDLATFSRKTALAILQGRVHIQSKEFELQAEKIHYDYHAERGKITARPGEQVQFVFYKMPSTNGLQPTTTDPVRQKVSGVATEILVNRPSRKMVLQGKVYIIDHSDQSQFRADRAELFFNEQEEIEIIIANGNFSMNQPGRVSRSDRAVFEYANEEVTLIGNAYVKEDNKVEVTSARIKMYIKVNQGIIRGVDDIPVKMEIE